MLIDRFINKLSIRMVIFEPFIVNQYLLYEKGGRFDLENKHTNAAIADMLIRRLGQKSIGIHRIKKMI